MHDSLGDRMKGQYEHRTRYFLPRRTYTIIRVDGKAFHSYTRGCVEPFDAPLMDAMDRTAMYLCGEMQGSVLAYVQSDEISVLLTDFAKPTTDAWFDGNVQKIASVSASLVSAYFNDIRRGVSPRMACFDARVFTIPDPVEVENYLIWRQQDATRNSIQMVAHTLYSHKQLHGANVNEMQDMIFQKGINWNDYSGGCKRGRVVVEGAERGWVIEAPPVFTQEREYLRVRIPLLSAWSLAPAPERSEATPAERPDGVRP